MIAAHRCGYMSNGQITHPENSLSAADFTMNLGVEILEVDIRMTSDGGLVLMHDSSVNRTTNGSGNVSDMTLDQVTSLKLKGSGGALSDETVPTLEELMLLVKGRAMVNLDKVNINDLSLRNAIMDVLIATGTVDHAIFKGGASASQVAAMRATYPGHSIHYMPILSNSSESGMISMLTAHSPHATEIIFNNSSTGMLSSASRSKATETDTHIWINSLWSSLCAGHHDAVALSGNPDGSWGWLIDQGATIIQTDNAPQLIDYLANRTSDPPEEPTPTHPFTQHSYDFDDGSLQGWTNTLTGNATDNPASFAPQTDQGRGGGQNSAYALMHSGNGTWLDGRDVAHPTLVCTSPAFDFDESLTAEWAITFHLLGGTGNTSTTPTSRETLAPASESEGFAGVALRRVSDGAYLLYDHRITSAQNADWQACGWSQQEIADALSDDDPAETYQLDFIDQNHGSWGWVMLDSIEIKGLIPKPDNMLSYYCGADLQNTQDNIQLSILTSADGTTTTRHFRALQRTGVSGQILWSSDMTTWHASGESDGNHTITMQETVTSNEDDNPQIIETSFHSSTGEQPPRLFLRLLVEPSPPASN